MQLIKTPIDLSYAKTGSDVLLLGTWCLKKNEDFLAARNVSDIVPYHWDDRDKYYSDYVYLTGLYEKILLSYSQTLNRIHGVTKDLEYWRVIIGPWLRFCLDALFDRYECVKVAKSLNNIMICTVGSYDLNDWYARDFYDFWEDFTSDEWNEVVFSECIKYQGLAHDIDRHWSIPSNRTSSSSGFEAGSFKGHIKSLLSKCFSLVSRWKKGTIFIASYATPYKLFKLYCSLRQVPYWLDLRIRTANSSINKTKRDSLHNAIEQSGFEGFVDNLLPYFIPQSYLEDFSKFKQRNLNALPNRPKSLFTASAYQADDGFKIWAAEQKKLGVPLIIGQHGGLYGIGKHAQDEDHQLLISTTFCSWGWNTCDVSNVKVLPSLQLSANAIKKPSKDGYILHVLSSYPRYFYYHVSIPVAGQFLSYLDDQLDFIRQLEQSQKESLKIRLDSSGSSRGWDASKLLHLKGYSDNIDQSEVRIWKLIQKSRLCVCTTNTTVFLETLSRNFPTIIFWDPKFFEIRPDAEPFIQRLLDAEILFYNPVDAANKVNMIADNIDEWWFSEKVQSARKIFCERYALTSSNWLEEWTKFLFEK